MSFSQFYYFELFSFSKAHKSFSTSKSNMTVDRVNCLQCLKCFVKWMGNIAFLLQQDIERNENLSGVCKALGS